MLFAMQHADRRHAACVVESGIWKGILMDPKLTILFMLIACIIGLSHAGDSPLARVWRLLPTNRLRGIMPGRRRV
jgi:hypothetical protein